MAKGGLFLEKLRRCLRTLFFVVAMVASLLVSSLPVLVAIGDVLVPWVLISSFTCVRCHGFKEHLRLYAFKSSLIDIPLVSVIRSFIIICVYSLCDAPGLSHGPYLGTVTLCSLVSILLLSVKACVFSVNSHLEADTIASVSRHRLHVKKSWGMPVLFLTSVVFALGHTVVAYRTSCRARRKLLFHRVDPESVLSCKSVFSGYQKVPRSPTPSGGKTPRSDSELRRKPFSRDEGDVPIRLLADIDSLFTTWQGVTLHYKLSLPDSPTRSMSSASSAEVSPRCCSQKIGFERPMIDRHQFNLLSKTQYNLRRSHSNQFHSSSLYDPLLDAPATSALSEEIPLLSLDDVGADKEMSQNLGTMEQDLERSDQFGIVLLHGFGGGVFSWRHIMGSLAKQVGCTVAAFDRPGWGLTSRPRVEDCKEQELPNPYKIETQVDLLLSFCAEMGFTSVVLIGHDDGGLLALKAVQRVQSSPRGSTCVSIRGVVLLGVSLSREVVPAFARILLRTPIGKKHLVRPLLRTEITQVVNRRAWYDATKLTTEVLSLYKAPLCVEGWDEALREVGRLSNETFLSLQNAESLLKAVEYMPVLVVGGAEDALVPLKSSQAMASKLVNSRLVAISGCGHLPHEECPNALLAAVSPFISRIVMEPDSQGNRTSNL